MTDPATVGGPLLGYRVIEMGSIGPVPFAAMLLADMGADVIRIDRPTAVRSPAGPPPYADVVLRGRRSVALDLKNAAGRDALLDLVDATDVLIEGFRPGVMERLGLGPERCLARNPRLIYGRLTGWGQDGPLAQAAGHDLNYIAFAGALAHFGRAHEKPSPPLNLVGDYGGGSMFLLFGVVCALLEAQRGGLGQVVDAAMVDGIGTLMSMFWGYAQSGRFDESARGSHHFDTGAHFFEVYECADGKFVSVAGIESQFYAELLARLGLADDPDFARQHDRSRWPALTERLAALFRTRTRDDWCAALEGTDACFAPVLTMSESAAHPHTLARESVVERDGIRQPAPAPRFSRTPARLGRPPAAPGQHSSTALRDWGFSSARVAALLEAHAILDASRVIDKRHLTVL